MALADLWAPSTPVGLFDLNHDLWLVGQAYQHLVRLFDSETLLTSADVKDLDEVLDLERARIGRVPALSGTL